MYSIFILINSLLLIIIIILFLKKKKCLNKLEHFNIQDKNNINKKLNTLNNKYNKMNIELNAKIDTVGKDSHKLITNKYINIKPPALQNNGTYIAVGPLSNKKSTGRLTRYAGETTPYFKKKDEFVSAYETWFYNKDGTIMNKYDSINNEGGACLYKIQGKEKCTNSKYNTKEKCINKNYNWIYPVGLIKDTSKCSNWTWDSYGRILYNNTTKDDPSTKCLIPAETNKNVIVGLETCSNNIRLNKHLWSFF